MSDHDMFGIGKAAILRVFAAQSLVDLANASFKLYAFNAARWLQRVTDILAAKLTAFEIVDPEQRDPPGMLSGERQVPVLHVQLMDYKGSGLKAASSGQSLDRLQRASSVRHGRAEMCPHWTLALEIQIQFGMGKRELNFEERQEIVREDGSKGGLGVTWRTEQVVHGGKFAEDPATGKPVFPSRTDLKKSPRPLFGELFDECQVTQAKMNYARASVLTSAMEKGSDLVYHLILLGNWATGGDHDKHNTGASVANQSYNFGGIPLRALAAVAGFRSVNGSVAYVLYGSRDTIVVPPVLKDAYAGGLKKRVETFLDKCSRTNEWPQGVNDAPALEAFVKVLDYLADVFWQDAAHLCALHGGNHTNSAFWKQDVFTSSTTRDAWSKLVAEAKSKVADPFSVAPEEMARAPSNEVHACNVMCAAMRSELNETMKRRMGAVQDELSQLQPLQRIAKAVAKEFKNDSTINDAPHDANPASMAAQIAAQVAPSATTAATTTTTTANKTLPQIERVTTATDVPSFIERYKVDTLKVAEVKTRFGLNDLELGQDEKKKLTSRVTSARGAARPYKPLFETLQHLIEIQRCSSDAIQTSVVATLGPTRSIRDEFKRMANELAGVDGVESRAEALKTAWNVTVDPK